MVEEAEKSKNEDDEIERAKHAAILLAKNLSNALNHLEETKQKVEILEKKKVPILENEIQNLKKEIKEVVEVVVVEKQQQQQPPQQLKNDNDSDNSDGSDEERGGGI